MADTEKRLADGTEVTWHYRSAIGHGTIEGVAEEADTSADTKYRIRQHDHHPDEPEIVEHYGRALTVVESANKSAPTTRTRVNLFAPISKVETTQDGGREVWGFATLERKDKVGEIADFERTVKAFERWSGDVSKRTGGKSMGNVRVMHQPIAAGKMTHWEPGETEIVDEDGNTKTVKGIWTATYIPPHKTDVIKDVDAGILSGLSIGGNYADRWWDDVEKAWRFEPDLAEYSLVDNPCVPGADIVNVVAKGVGPWSHPDRNLAKAETTDEDTEREKLHQEAQERAKKYGISVKEGGHLTPPKGKPTDVDQYADRTNYAYPIDEAHIKAAMGYFNHPEEREKGGYSEEEWAIIGKRIADAANKLIGEGHEFKDGKIETSDDRKEAEKARWSDLCKRAGVNGEMSFEDIRNAVSCAINKGNPMMDFWVIDTYPDYVIADDWDTGKYWKVPYTMKGDEVTIGVPEEVTQGDWKPVKEAQKLDNNTQVQKADPNDKAVDEKIAALEKELAELKAAQQKDDEEEDKEDAEKAASALEILKGITGRLEKRGTAISASRRTHLQHAVDHIHKALGEDDKVQDKEHIDGKAPEPDNNEKDMAEKVAAAVLAKFDVTTLQKSAPDVGASLAQTLENAGLAKAEVVTALSEQLTKAVEQIGTLEGLVKEIGAQPQQGGPMTAVYPGLAGMMPWKNVEKSVLENVLQNTDNPVLKDALGRELATEVYAQQLSQQARKPTA